MLNALRHDDNLTNQQFRVPVAQPTSLLATLLVTVQAHAYTLKGGQNDAVSNHGNIFR